MFAVKPEVPDSFVKVGFEMVGDPGDTATKIVPRDRYLRAIRLATTVITAVILLAGLAACNEKSPEGRLENPQLEYHGKIDVQVITLDNGKKVNCAVAAANGVSMTCDWCGTH